MVNFAVFVVLFLLYFLCSLAFHLFCMHTFYGHFIGSVESGHLHRNLCAIFNVDGVKFPMYNTSLDMLSGNFAPLFPCDLTSSPALLSSFFQNLNAKFRNF